jgi:hypothetical protein
MIKLKPLVESKYSHDHVLYHYTSLENLIAILVDDFLEATNHKHDNSVYNFTDDTISLSRSKQWMYIKAPSKNFVVTMCAIELNADKLSNKYKLEPYDFFNNRIPADEQTPMGDGYNKHWHHEFEEVVRVTSFKQKGDKKITGIPNINSYINCILLSRPNIESVDSVFNHFSYDIKSHIFDYLNFGEWQREKYEDMSLLDVMVELLENNFNMNVKIVPK